MRIESASLKMQVFLAQPPSLEMTAIGLPRSLAPVLLLAASACGGNADAGRKTVFDPTMMSGPPVALPAEGVSDGAIEQPYAPLDRAEVGKPPYLGMTVLRGRVHLSRPKGWMVRDASNDPGHAYIRYVSPRAYSFAIYERSDAPARSAGAIFLESGTRPMWLGSGPRWSANGSPSR